ncbi:DUF6428 family protein [Planctomicrobium sp. SH661]|uniref:DUF6428 family protein n=1 Tax=Planctomicrobium sp. SH661 TaxID=3448124 RepID=UPI003F5B1F3E
MMTLQQFKAVLAENPSAALNVRLPNGNLIPHHFHVTEVGRVQKDFIDCGGTVRSTAACVLQTWVANDLDHRLSPSKLGTILEMASPLLRSDDLPVEIEFDAGVISQYPVSEIRTTAQEIELRLTSKKTDCLAPDRCGLTVLSSDCCSSTGCC